MHANRFALAAAAITGIFALAACDTARTIENDGGGGGACAACHGFPPPPPASASTHPQIAQCVLCHSATVDANNDLVPGGPHNNGTTDVTGHPAGFSTPSVHGPAAIANVALCQACHGSDFGGGYASSCNACHAAAGWSATALTANCSFCHGTKDAVAKAGYVFGDHPAWAAPPEAVDGDPSNPAVGAHQSHLLGESYSTGFACAQCHAVPTDLGHVADGATGADFTWGPLASQGATPAFDGVALTCTNYCHGATLVGGAGTSPAWTSTSVACAGCHGIPPDSGQHLFHVNDRAVACATCHKNYSASTVNPPTHVDGTRNVVLQDGTTITGWACATCHAALGVTVHAVGYSDPTVHGPDAIAGIATCQSCHGADFGGGLGPSCNACHETAGWNAAALTTNCTFCHGTKTRSGYDFATAPKYLAAPPEGVAGATVETDPHVGAHQAHLTGGTYSTPIACAQCHAEPADLSHVNGTVAFAWGSLATTDGATPTFNATGQTCTNYCHGSTLDGGLAQTPSFTATDLGATALERCSACHGSAPSGSLVGPNTGRHDRHVVAEGYRCYLCHNTVAANVANTAPALQADHSLHLNGLKNVSSTVFTWDPAANGGRGECSAACHGARGWY
ncbi:MAG TPA: CxxxxCH/CxxCH domain-containing protein [Anaeromyxobacteraceae bacterium]|nr:CxxxxCH/CxxCH domain-containing protein [Anaeromyxobacteraceae bacterium]